MATHIVHWELTSIEDVGYTLPHNYYDDHVSLETMANKELTMQTWPHNDDLFSLETMTMNIIMTINSYYKNRFFSR